jgi:hypothetical protein
VEELEAKLALLQAQVDDLLSRRSAADTPDVIAANQRTRS